MRYVSQYDDLVLYRNDGLIAHKFHNGVLVVGDATTRNGTNLTTDTKGFVVDYFEYATDPGREIQGIKKDFAGKLIDEVGAVRIECNGLGYLAGKKYDGSTAIALHLGYKGTFFEAPALTATTLPATVGIMYEVLSGSVTYDGKTYKMGQFFVTNGKTSLTVNAGGTYALSANVLRNIADQYTQEAFASVHLLTPNDALEYWNHSNGGYTPIDSLSTTDFNFIGRNNKLIL